MAKSAGQGLQRWQGSRVAPERARGLHRAAGFVETGERDDGEIVMVRRVVQEW
jgi:hypothetical protein